MATPKSGHGALVYIEMDPVGSPGTFTAVPELNVDLTENLSRASTEITPHNRTVSERITSALVQVAAIAMTVNYDSADSVHIKLLDHFLANTTFGIAFRGPGWTTPGTDEIIQSGELIGWTDRNPVREGIRACELSFQPSGAFKINGTLYT